MYSTFHAQQAVEKYLKAFLVENNKPYPRTHDIRLLVKECMNIVQYLLDIHVDKLTIYATEYRYPEINHEITREEAIEAIRLAKETRRFVLKKLG